MFSIFKKKITSEDLLIKHLKQDEGLRLKPYKCPAGKLTIGIGRNIEDNGISESEAEYLLNNDIKESIKEAKDLFRQEWEGYTEHQKAGIINMIFNLGINRFKGFKTTIKHLRNYDFLSARKSAKNSKWARQVGLRADRVTSLFLNEDIYHD